MIEPRIDTSIFGCQPVASRYSKTHLAAVTLVVAFSGCSYFVSWDESVRGGVGRSIADIQRTWGVPDEVLEMSDGNWEYKYHLRQIDPSCFHYWIVDSEGIITGYHFEGRCRPIG